MPQAVAQSRVIYHHPRGRFDVIEIRGTSPLGLVVCDPRSSIYAGAG